MGRRGVGRGTTLLLCTGVLGAGVAVPATAQAARSCKAVSNPYPGTRYEGIPLSSIRATGVSCATARRTAKGAHSKALGLTPSPSGIRRFRWNGWSVVGDLRGERDSYVARRNGNRVTWRF